jgi:photosystem II stability/assembly factor-like uncharacterized protein
VAQRAGRGSVQARIAVIAGLVSVALAIGCGGGPSDSAASGNQGSAAAAATPTATPTPSGSKNLASQAYVWKSVKIVDGGVMPGIVMHPTQAGLMYVRADVGGAYRWNASQKLWIPLLDFLGASDWSLTGVESIAVDPTDASRVYIVAGTFLTESYSSNAAVFISNDRGATFQRTNLPFKTDANGPGHMAGERLAVNPAKPSEIYLGTHLQGLWRSTDRGATWGQVTSFPITSSPDQLGVTWVRFDSQHPGTVYAAAYTGGLYRSTDSGATWRPIPGQPTSLPNGDTARPMRSALGPDGLLYVTYTNSADWGGINNGAVYRLDTSSGVWTNVTPRGPNGETRLWYGFCAVTADAQRSATVMVATWNRWSPGDTIYRSTDAGATWTSLSEYSARDGSLSPYVYQGGSEAYFGCWISTLEIDPLNSNHALYQAGNTIWATNDLTNLDARNTTHWTIGADGIEETVVMSLISPSSGAHLLSGVGDEGGFRHDDLAVSPPPFLNPLMVEASFLDFAGLLPSFIARVGILHYNQDQGGAYSVDGGSTWTPFPSNPPGLENSSFGNMIAVSADAAALVWAPGAAGPAFSRDRGATWTVSRGAPVKLRVVADRVTAETFYGYDGVTGTFYVSTDGGATFSVRATGVPQDSGGPGWSSAGQPRAVAGREGDLWLPLSSGLYHSTDSGASFAKISAMTECGAVGFGMPAEHGAYPAVYAVGTVGNVRGIFRSDDQGASWTRLNDDQHQYGPIGVIIGDPRIYGRVYLGTAGRGIVYGDIAAPAFW